MPDSKRQKIVDRVIAALQQIKTVNGYETNLGNRVEDFEMNFDNKDLPAISVFDLDAPVEPVNGQTSAAQETHTLNVKARAFLKSGTPAKEARKALAEMVKAVGTNQRWNDGTENLALSTKLTKQSLVVPEESFELAAAEIDLEIRYLTERFNSYQ